MQTYIDWIAPTFLVTLCSLPPLLGALRQDKARHAGGLADREPPFRQMRNLSLVKVVQDLHPLGWPSMVNEHG